MANILVVDDELGIRDLLSEILNDEGHTVELAENAAQARARAAAPRPDLVLLDIWMPDTDGVTLLKEWSTSGLLSMPVIMMSGHATIETAVEATKIGAHRSWKSRSRMQKLLRRWRRAWRATSRRAVHARKPGTARGGADAGAGAHGGSRHDRRPDACRRWSTWARRRASCSSWTSRCAMRATNSRSRYFEFHLAKEGGSMTRVAEKTGLERTHLYRKLKQLGVDLSRGKRGAADIIAGSGPVAQLVEQRIENPRVGGSIPPQATSTAMPRHLSRSGASLFQRTGNVSTLGPHVHDPAGQSADERYGSVAILLHWGWRRS